MVKRRLVIVLTTAIAVAIVIAAIVSRDGVPEHAVLVVELSGALRDAPQSDLLSQLSSPGPALATLLLQLQKARADARIEAVLLHLRGLSAGIASLQELRGAITDVRAAEKKVVALVDIAGLNATGELYLASAADEVYVVPGMLGPVSGLAGQFLHLGGLLEKVGVAVEFERIGQYKSAPEQFAARMSDPARKMYDELLTGLFDQIVGGIAERRGLSVDAVREIIDRAPGTPDQWIEAKLADGIAGREDVLETAGLSELEEISYERYFGVDPSSLGLRSGARIALVFGSGTIVPGEGGAGSWGGGRIADAIRDAAEDDAFAAIVFRVNSGGGSPLGSEEVWRAIRDAREKKPVVVSMGDAAASGGYYVASAADAIVAQPATQTGSIGVFFLRPSLGELYADLGVRTELIKRGRLSGWTSDGAPLSGEERALLREIVRSTYETFLDRVSTGRGIAVSEVDAVGQGRVWLGSSAVDISLVDALGGLDEAVRIAKEKAGIPAETDPIRQILPPPPGALEQLRGLLSGSIRAALLARVRSAHLPAWLGLLDLEGPVLAAPYALEISL